MLRSVPTTVNLPSANSRSGSGGCEQVRREPLALVDDFTGREAQRRTADDHRARAVRAHAEGHPIGVAVDVLDVVRVEAEPLAEDLLECRLMPLTMRLGPHQQHRGAARIETDFGIFRYRAGSRFDRVGEPDAAQHAAPRRLLAPWWEARV